MKPYFDMNHRVAISPLPLYHIYAFTVNMLANYALGFKTILVLDPSKV